MRTIAVVTVGRSDFGAYRPVLQRILATPALKLQLIVSGTHLVQEFGATVREIEAEGFLIAERVEMLTASDAPLSIAQSLAAGVAGFGAVFDRSRPDVLVLLGDRFEMFAAAIASLSFNIPVAHIHGGERSEGAIDEAIRHSITKMSHLHFVALDEYARRVLQLGESSGQVVISGAPSLDNLSLLRIPTPTELESEFGVRMTSDTLLVTYHPVTLDLGVHLAEFDELLAALGAANRPVVFTYPNADTGGRQVIERIKEHVGTHANAQAVASLGSRGYFGVMAAAAAMVGNSSSGIIEAASFRLPVVDIGIRQRGRVRPANVVNASPNRHDIAAAIERVTSASFRESLVNLTNPYGEGCAAERIVSRLVSQDLGPSLLQKTFHAYPA